MRNDEFKTFYAVWTKPQPGFPGSYKPMKKTFASFAKADKVAQHMARRNPGKKFFVVQAVERVVIDEAGIDTRFLDSR